MILIAQMHYVVRAGGLEPPRPYGQQILSLARLPFRHARITRTLWPVKSGL